MLYIVRLCYVVLSCATQCYAVLGRGKLRYVVLFRDCQW